MQRLEVSGAVRPIYGSLGVKSLIHYGDYFAFHQMSQMQKRSWRWAWGHNDASALTLEVANSTEKKLEILNMNHYRWKYMK